MERWKDETAAHHVACSTQECVCDHPPSGNSAVGNEDRIVIKGQDATKPDTKYFNCELLFLFPLEVQLHLVTGIKVEQH